MGTRILSVEDDERIRTAVKLALEDEGWSVEEADTGEEALSSFQRQPADVVLIDIMLPGIDGFDVCRAIRRSSDVPIVMVTARADTHDVVAGLEAGADEALGCGALHRLPAGDRAGEGDVSDARIRDHARGVGVAHVQELECARRQAGGREGLAVALRD